MEKWMRLAFGFMCILGAVVNLIKGNLEVALLFGLIGPLYFDNRKE